MNPSLQNPYMLAHPPLLYLGYVGLGVPFAFAMGALLSGALDERWLDRDAPLDALRVGRARDRPAARQPLGVRRGRLGRLLRLGSCRERGAHAVARGDGVPALRDDPGEARDAEGLERAPRDPRVLALALRHVPDASGVVNSIHSFTESSIGPWFLGVHRARGGDFDCARLWRLPRLRSPTRLESPVSREAAFLYNNLLLLAFCLAILWGVVYPIVSQVVRGESVVLGRGYYDFFLRAFGLPLLLLMGIGPLIAWRRASLRSLATTFRWPTAFALGVGVVLLFLGAGSSIPGLVAYTFSAFVLATIVLEFARGTRARKALGATSWPGAFSSLVSRNRRRYGGYVVHAAIVLLAIGVAGSSAFDKVSDAKLTKGESMRVGDYTLVYRSLSERSGANATEIRATLDVSRRGHDLGTIRAGKNAYTIEQQVSNEVGIRSDHSRVRISS